MAAQWHQEASGHSREHAGADANVDGLGREMEGVMESYTETFRTEKWNLNVTSLGLQRAFVYMCSLYIYRTENFNWNLNI